MTVGYGTSNPATTSYLYNSFGKVLFETDPNNNVTAYTYNAAGQPLTVTRGNGTGDAATVVYTYDTAGNVTSETDPVGNYTKYTYDGTLLRLVQVYDNPNQQNLVQQTSYDYDAMGNVIDRLDNAGRQTSYRYDAAGQLTGMTYYDSNAAITNDYTYTYDKAGNLRGSLQKPSRLDSYEGRMWRSMCCIIEMRTHVSLTGMDRS
jgi:YD repeat-containing protein